MIIKFNLPYNDKEKSKKMRKWFNFFQQSDLIDVYLEALYECEVIGNEDEWDRKYKEFDE